MNSQRALLQQVTKHFFQIIFKVCTAFVIGTQILLFISPFTESNNEIQIKKYIRNTNKNVISTISIILQQHLDIIDINNAIEFYQRI